MEEKLLPDSFLKIQYWAYLWINSLKLYTVIFQSGWGLLKLSIETEGYRNVLKLSCRPLAFNSYKAFYNNKMRSGDISLVIFY